jgi:hypothetical protein
MHKADSQSPSPPSFPDELLSAAAQTPGGWVYAIDPAFDPRDRIPPEGVIGAWKIDDSGQPTGEYTPNPNYRPSEIAKRSVSPSAEPDDYERE